VRSGPFKSYVYTQSGEEEVIGFHLPGELLGFDAIETDYHVCSAVALETSSVCKPVVPGGQAQCRLPSGTVAVSESPTRGGGGLIGR
jgi:hypothetical protein